MAVCKGCGAEIKWIKTATGKNTPVDAVSEKRYSFFPFTDEWLLLDSYQSHWATCPNANQFRKGKPNAKE